MAKIELKNSISTKSWSNLMLQTWDYSCDQHFMRYTYGENMNYISQALASTLGAGVGFFVKYCIQYGWFECEDQN
jgi:hypothetical protein